MKKPDIIGRYVPPSVRFWSGLAVLPGYFLVDGILLKLCLIGVFVLITLLSGRKIRLGYYLIMTASIVFFHLLSPVGRILWVIGPFRLTEGALESGLLRGITLIGLILISLFSVTRELMLPGRLGGLLGRMFLHYEEILESKKKIAPKNFIGSLDDVLLSIFSPEESVIPVSTAGSVEKKGYHSRLVTILYIISLTGAVWGSAFYLLLF